jgi:hypothetical protein
VSPGCATSIISAEGSLEGIGINTEVAFDRGGF